MVGGGCVGAGFHTRPRTGVNIDYVVEKEQRESCVLTLLFYVVLWLTKGENVGFSARFLLRQFNMDAHKSQVFLFIKTKKCDKFIRF